MDVLGVPSAEVMVTVGRVAILVRRAAMIK